MLDDYEVGYGRPPKEHRFRKGQSGNPNGRPKKKLPDPDANSMASILRRVGEQTIEYAGERLTLMEVEVRALQAKAARGDIAACRQLDRKRKEAGLLEPKPVKGGGVLVVPAPMSFDDWDAQAALQQAKFRGEDPEGLERLEQRARDASNARRLDSPSK